MIPTTFPILDFSKKLLNIQPGYKILIGGGSILVGMCICSDHFYNIFICIIKTKQQTSKLILCGNLQKYIKFEKVFTQKYWLPNGQIFQLVLTKFFEQATSLRKI
jgi:hypothetical protein